MLLAANVQLYEFLNQIVTVIVSVGFIGIVITLLINRYFKKLDEKKKEDREEDDARKYQVDRLYEKFNDLITKVDILITQLSDHKQHDEEFRSNLEGRMSAVCDKVKDLKNNQDKTYKELKQDYHNFDKMVYGVGERLSTLESFINRDIK